MSRLGQFSAEQLADAVRDLHPALRAEFLELVERADEVVPLLAEAEFTVMVRATGIADAGWLVAYATPEQRVAAVDLDCWKDFRFSPSRLFEWIDAMIAAGPEVLVAAFDEQDAEVWVLAMKEMADFVIPGLGGTGPADYTEDGLVFYGPRSDEHEERVRAILRTALIDSPAHYWQFVLGAIEEGREEVEEYAERWHRGRLADLGFPERRRAMHAYRPLGVDAVPVVDVGAPKPAGRAIVAAPRLPQRLAGTLVGRALAELGAERAADVLGYVLAVANTIAVADELPLSEPESMETALAKAVGGIDRGLAELAKARDQSLGEVLDATRPLDLFRIGATLDPQLRPAKTLADLEELEWRDDWNVELEEISEEDSTLRGDGRPRGR